MFVSRVEREIKKLRQRISEGDDNRPQSVGNEETGSPVGHIQGLNTVPPLSDERYESGTRAVRAGGRGDAASCVCLLRINAYIEEEVRRRLREMNLLNGGADLTLSSDSLRVRVGRGSVRVDTC